MIGQQHRPGEVGVATTPTTTRQTDPPARNDRAAVALFVAMLFLQFFRTNAEERWLARLLPLAAIVILLVRPRATVATYRLPLTFAGFGIWSLLSLMWTADPAGSPMVLLDLWSGLLVGWSCAVLLPLDRVLEVLASVVKVVACTVVAFLVVLPAQSTRPSPEDGAPGWHGPFDHKNGLGGFLVIAAIAVAFDRTTTPARRLGWLSLFGVLLVGSRSSSAVALVVLVVAVLALQRTKTSIRSTWPRVLLSGLSALVLIAGLLGAVTASTSFTSVLGRNATFSGRTLIWQVVIERIGQRPWVGWGYGGMWRPTSLPSQQMWREMRFHAYHAHEGYLDLLLQVGLVGAALFCCGLFYALVRLWRHRTSDPHFWAFLSLLTIAVNATTESGPFFEGIALVVLFCTVARTQRAGPEPSVPAVVAASKAGR